MLMLLNLSKTGLRRQPKPPPGEAERQRSAVRREAVRPTAASDHQRNPVGTPLSHPKSSLLFFNSSPDLLVLATKNLEYPKITFVNGVKKFTEGWNDL